MDTGGKPDMKFLLYALLSFGLALGVRGNSRPGRKSCRVGAFIKRLRAEHKRRGEKGARRLAKLRRLKLRRIRRRWHVPIILEPEEGKLAADVDLKAIEKHGVRVDAMSKSFIRVLVPFRQLGKLESLPCIARARAPLRMKALGGLGSNISESVALTGAGDVQDAGVTGDGVKIAIVDLGFIGLTSRINGGELPADTVKVLLPGQKRREIEQDEYHGTGVAEHAADMAPGAQIYCIKIEDLVDLENAATYCANNGVSIANLSVGWVLAGGYYKDDGVVNPIINSSRDNDGVFWAVAAGNDVGYHWRGTSFADADGDNYLDFGSEASNSGELETTEVNLLAVAESENMPGYGVATIYLNWDQYGDVATDLDLLLVYWNGTGWTVDERSEISGDDPEEVHEWYVNMDLQWGFAIEHKSGPLTPLDMTVFSFHNQFVYDTPGSSLMDPANSHGAFSVAAVRATEWNKTEPAQEWFSSQGPTNDGRMKPQLAAPDGTVSATYGASYGTSFASPTTAGAAALILQANPTFNADQVAAKLQSLAVDVGDTGHDYIYGAGLLDLRGLLTQVSIVSVLPLCADADNVPKHSKFELEVALGAVAATKPFLGDASAGGVDLTATFTGPSGPYTVPGFYDGNNWRVRFAPNEIGAWEYEVNVADKSGSDTFVGGTFTCTASTNPGHIRVSGRRLKYADGSVFFGVGHNNGWQYNVEQPYENPPCPTQPTFAQMAADGENLLSFWMAVPWAEVSWSANRMPLEHDDAGGGLGVYEQQTALYIDNLVDGAGQAGVHLLPTIWSHGQLRDPNHGWSGSGDGDNNWWHRNVYGEICASPVDFFKTDGAIPGSNTRQWRYQKNYLRYLNARWGYATSVAGWVTLCEADGTNAWGGTAGKDKNALRLWGKKVRQYFVDNDPYRTNASGQHPNTSTMVNNPGWDGQFPGGGELDLRSMDRYNWNSYDDILVAQTLANDTATMWNSGRPSFHAEFGGPSWRDNTQPLHLHNGIWAATASGAAITPLVWCDGYDFTLITPEMRLHLGYLGKFVKTISYFGDASLTRSTVTCDSPCRGWGLQLSDKGFAWIQATSGNVDGKSVSVSGLDSGSYKVAWYNTWEIGADPTPIATVDVTVSGSTLTATIPDAGTPDVAVRYWKVTNQPPVVASDSYAVEQDAVLGVPAVTGVLANDADPEGLALTAELVSGPSHGTLDLLADGSFTYTPDAGFQGTDSFTYAASDGTLESDPAAAKIAVMNSGVAFVNGDATGANNGSCWADAFNDLQDGLDAAEALGKEVWVAGGTYAPSSGTDRDASFVLRFGVAVYGGFAAIETTRGERDPDVYVTILSGEIGAAGISDNSYHVVKGTDGATLDGFTITAGNANGTENEEGGGGLLNYFASPDVVNCIFAGNAAERGGAICNHAGSPTVTDCEISGNTGSSGGAVWTFRASPVFERCVISGNTASNYGGGFFSREDDSVLKNCLLTGNTATNQAGGGIYTRSSALSVVNTTITGNSATTGGALANYDGSAVIVTSAVLWANTATTGNGVYNSSSTCTVSYSCVEGGHAGTENIDTDPGFVGGGNYHLKSRTGHWDGDTWVQDTANSPCLDTGDPTADASGEPAPAGSRVNMGSYGGTAEASKSAGSAVIYVDLNATGANTGLSWADAYADLQSALAVGLSGNEIWVAMATYEPGTERGSSFELVEGVAVYGGFNATETDRGQRNPSMNVTTLSGEIGAAGVSDNCYHVLKGAEGSTLDGFTISGGNADGSGDDGCGGGMLSVATSSTVTGCVFTGNNALRGGGFYVRHGSPTVTSCRFENNTASNGGGMWLYSSTAQVTTCELRGNTATTYGGGMYNWNASPVVRNCLFAGNTVTSLSGGGMHNDAASPAVRNCTFSSNSAVIGGGMASYKSSVPTVENCIFWGNTATRGSELYRSSSTHTVTHSCIQGGHAGIGNISSDPLFADAAGGDFHLKSEAGHWTPTGWVNDTETSPCVDAGDPGSAHAQEASFNGDRANMGAYGNTDQASRTPLPGGTSGEDPSEDLVAPQQQPEQVPEMF